MLNKIYLILILVLFLVLINFIKKKEKFTTQNNFLIVVAFYNPGELYLEKCLRSIVNQDYKNYKVCLVNDKSTKEVKEIENLCRKYEKNHGWTYKVNDVNNGPCYSRIEGIKLLNPKDEDIIVLVDGDDKLHNDKVLSKLNNEYQDNTQVTFGNFIRVNKNGRFRKSSIKCHKYNINKMAEKKNFRDIGGYPFSHLKTFKYKLYKNLNLNDLKKEGEYIRSSTDAAVMFPLLEMAGNNIKCINDILYDYTIDHNESFHNNFEKKKTQTENFKFVKNLKKYETLPENQKKTFHIYYINLKKRTDRRKFIENQLKQLEYLKDYRFIARRLPAVKNLKHGAIGCGKSHIKVLEKAKKLNLPFVFVMEDDIKIKFNLLKESLKLIEKKQDYDVIILSGHGERNYFNSDFDKAIGIQTTGWYLVKNHYYDKLIKIFQESVDEMEKSIDNGQDANLPVWAIDMNWKKLQMKDNWFILKKNLGYQISNRSDISNDVVDYTQSLN